MYKWEKPIISKYKFSDGFSLNYDYHPSFIAYSDSFTYQYPKTSKSSVTLDSHSKCCTYNPVTGDLITTTSHAIEYTIEPQVNEHRVIDIDNGQETPSPSTGSHI